MDKTGPVNWDEGCPCSSGVQTEQTFDGYEKVGLDLEITRGVPSSLSLSVARAEANLTRSNDRFLSL